VLFNVWEISFQLKRTFEIILQGNYPPKWLTFILLIDDEHRNNVHNGVDANNWPFTNVALQVKRIGELSERNAPFEKHNRNDALVAHSKATEVSTKR
jgi:hypothetical protein